jgi:LuxR family transcriptional regulator of spore coat protein
MPDTNLSDREVACLHWSSLGKTSWETGHILGMAERTVNFHIRNACQKLGVNNRRAAVAIALWRGLLPRFTGEPGPGLREPPGRVYLVPSLATSSEHAPAVTAPASS